MRLVRLDYSENMFAVSRKLIIISKLTFQEIKIMVRTLLILERIRPVIH